VLRQIAAHLGVDDEPEHLPSDEADVFRLGAFVVKIERPPFTCVAREQVVFPALRLRGFTELPEVALTQAHVDDVGATFMVMPFVPSRPLVDIWCDDRRAAMATASAVGAFLRRMARLDWRRVPGAVTAVEQQRSHREWMTRWLSVLPGDHDDVLSVFDEVPREFGSWQFCQLRTLGGPTFTAIDWGSIGAFWMYSDVLTTEATLADVDDALVRAFRDGYGPIEEDRLAPWRRLWEAFARAAALRQQP
jgi:hypothetical protein